MKDITYEMVREYQIKELGYDFMGYYRQLGDRYTFHHTILPKRDGGQEEKKNGSILYTTPHVYIHTIEEYEEQAFAYITMEIMQMNLKGYLDPVNIKRIHDTLEWFESRYGEEQLRGGKMLIKDNFRNRVKF